MDVLDCPLFPQCSGCDSCGESLPVQKQRKVQDLESRLLAARIAFPLIDFQNLGLGGLRDRLDFTLENGRLGLYDRDRQQIVDLSECGQLSRPLHSWLMDFRQSLPPVAKMSIRLRVSPSGVRGMWLDFANVEVKVLLDEQSWLRSFGDDVVIEIGQRRKRLERGGERLRLLDPVLFPWFETSYRSVKVPLFGTVGSFTQPSLRANVFIGEWIAARVRASSPSQILEFGTGQGNLSFPALGAGATSTKLIACENDVLALDGFEKSLQHLADTAGIDLRSQVRIQPGDYRRHASDELLSSDFLLANPARSGLGEFLNPLTDSAAMSSVLMMSCHPESFTEDAVKLVAKGFAIKELCILDQFPQTKHYEVLSFWRRA